MLAISALLLSLSYVSPARASTPKPDGADLEVQGIGGTLQASATWMWSSPAGPGVSAGSSDSPGEYAYGGVDPLCPSGKRSAVPVTVGGVGKELMVCLDTPVTQAPAGAPVSGHTLTNDAEEAQDH